MGYVESNHMGLLATGATARTPPPQQTSSLASPGGQTERDFIVDNLLVRIHLMIEKILVDRPCAVGV